MKLKLNESKQNLQSLTDENASLIKKFLFELEKKKTKLEVAHTRLEELNHLVHQCKSERKLAEMEAIKSSKSIVYMEDHYKTLIRDRDDQISDILIKSKNEIKIAREQFNLEQSRLVFEIDELKKSKVGLQSEIGHLLRDKRRIELDLESGQRVYLF